MKMKNPFIGEETTQKLNQVKLRSKEYIHLDKEISTKGSAAYAHRWTILPAMYTEYINWYKNISRPSPPMDKLRRALAGDDGRDDDSTTGIIPPTVDSSTPLLPQYNFDTTTLSWSTRIKCFAFCFILGILLSMLASLSLFLHRGWEQFSILYTFGNIISMLSTLFLMGPMNQIKKMFAPTRVVATILVLVMIVLTLVAGFVMKNAGLAFLFIIMQWMAMTWYSLSYIPYARDAVKKTVETCIA